LEEAQNQLLQSEKMASIGQLAAGVAHEINNPIGFVNSNLGSLRRYVQTLLDLIAAYGRHRNEIADAELTAMEKAADLEFLVEDLPTLLHESEEGLSRVRKIVQDLKDFSRVDSADWQDADINAGLESTLNVVMNEIKYRADVERHLGPLPPVRCLAGQLNQVFMNLIVNATHAMEGKRGVLTLSTRCETRDDVDGVWVEVADTGKGMSAEVQRRIFEPFFTTKPVGQGTGLGLSLSFSIVKKHGGHIDLHSEPGVGTRFKVWVPVAGPSA
jgi:signal transduction histidine kinase